MEQTLHGCTGCTADRILVTKPPYWFSDPEPGDVVVVEGPDAWPSETQADQPTNWFGRAALVVGRVVGAARPSDRDFVERVIAVGGQTVQCCDDQLWVMGDHRSNSADSRDHGPAVLLASALPAVRRR